MIFSVILRSEAEADVRETFDELETVKPGLGGRFVAQLEVVLDRIERMPEMYGVLWQDVRAARLKRMRHVVYYVVFADRVEVLAVLHGSCDSSAWRSRV